MRGSAAALSGDVFADFEDVKFHLGTLLDFAHAPFRRGMSFVQQTGARVFEPQIVQERAWLAQLRGDSAAASEELQRAHALYVEIGATGHAERLTKGVVRGGPLRANCVSMQPVA